MNQHETGKKTMIRNAIVLTALLSSGAFAQEAPPQFAAVPEPPEIPTPIQSGQTLEPDVTIIQKKDRIETEYRVNGQLYMIKVMPRGGYAPYYLVDRDGDGRLESQFDDLASITPPQWVIHRW